MDNYIILLRFAFDIYMYITLINLIKNMFRSSIYISLDIFTNFILIKLHEYNKSYQLAFTLILLM